MFKVMIVSDLKIMRNVMCSKIIESGNKIIGQSNYGYEALLKYKKLKPDVVAMNVSILEFRKNDIQTLNLIKEYDADAFVIVIASKGDELKVIESINLGAKDYIIQPISVKKIKNAFMKKNDFSINNKIIYNDNLTIQLL